MARWKGKSEHAGHKGSTRKGGYWGKRADANYDSKKQRRMTDAELIKETTSYDGRFDTFGDDFEGGGIDG